MKMVRPSERFPPTFRQTSSRVTFSKCRNASAVLLSQINQSRAGAQATAVTRRVKHLEHSRSPPLAPGATEAEEFIARLGLDEKVVVERFRVEEYIERQSADEGAENSLRACPGEI